LREALEATVGGDHPDFDARAFLDALQRRGALPSRSVYGATHERHLLLAIEPRRLGGMAGIRHGAGRPRRPRYRLSVEPWPHPQADASYDLTGG
jgi:hypothetical protein